MTHASHNYTEEQVQKTVWVFQNTFVIFQLECEAERKWPLFVYSILATFLVSLIIATLQWLLCGKKTS